MAIFIRIQDDALEASLKALTALQIPRSNVTALGEAILRAAVRACESDPEAWKKIGQSCPLPHPTDGSQAEATETPSILGVPIVPDPDGSVVHSPASQAASSTSQESSSPPPPPAKAD